MIAMVIWRKKISSIASLVVTGGVASSRSASGAVGGVLNGRGRGASRCSSVSLLLAFFGFALLGLAASVLALIWVCAEFATSCWSLAELSRAALVVAPRLASGLGV